MNKLIEGLNNKQREAVLQTEGPVLILAGAGSGKTRALTYRVAYLIKEKKISPQNILAVTFTNKAAGEMLERVKKMLGLPEEISSYSQYLPTVGTFHSVCVKILRKEAERIGYKRNFIIYDPTDQKATMKSVMRELDISPDQMKPPAILGTISAAKNKLIDAVEFTESAGSYFEEIAAKCYVAYQKKLKEANAFDFDDLIMVTVKMFQQYPDILEKYQNLFRYIMVDEYQDTNHAQYLWLKLLAQKYRNLCAVGDDAQAIYGWRQADIENILSFEKDYSEAKVILLEQNYRSTKNILDAAHSVIIRNVNQKKKKLWTENDKGDLLTIFRAQNEVDEAGFVVKKIVEMQKKQKLKLDDFAVLYRTNAQSRALEEAFLKAGVPYRIVGGTKFYERKEIKDILAYLYFMVNPKDQLSFRRIINAPARGIGDKTVEKITKAAQKEEGDILRAIDSLAQAEILQPKKMEILKVFAGKVKTWQIFAQTQPLTKVIEKVYQDSGYELMLNKLGDEGSVRAEYISELLTVAKKFDLEEMRQPTNSESEGKVTAVQLKNQNPILSFLEEVALVSQTDRDLDKKDLVPLMTLHAAKGLEYEVIFLVGMEEGIFPHSRSVLSEKEMEEERRLCYVGITRAKEKAYLTYTQSRTIYGTTQISTQSRFLNEIDTELVDEEFSSALAGWEREQMNWGSDFFEENFKKKKRNFRLISEADFSDDFFQEKTIELDQSSDSEPSSNLDLKDGDRVKHPIFGEGIVVMSGEEEINVAFPGVGLKKLVKNMAPLRKLN